MLRRALENLKGHINIEKEHSKADIHYIKKLKESLMIDLVNTSNTFNSERKTLMERIEIAEKDDIEDKFLITKCNEFIEESAKLSKKLSKYKDSKRLKSIKFKDMYTYYLLIVEANESISIMRNYMAQLLKMMNKG